MNRIIYKNKDNTVSVLIPAKEVLDTVGLQAIAEKDVPAPYKYPLRWESELNEDSGEYEDVVAEWAEYNTPYWLVSDTDIPSDRTDRDRWVLEDMPEPDGFGGTSNEFTDAELQALYAQGVIK